jgi:hypothetical protein
MTNKNLGRLQKVELREVWISESTDFTPWLAQSENLKLLGETIGMDLEFEAQEKNVGPFRADILCKDTATDSWVLIENQLERTDHGHLGQLLTYAAGLDAVTIVWVAEHFTEEHRAALDWLNERTDDKITFFGLEVELWQIGESQIAPKFNIVSKPNDWARTISETAKQLQAGAVSETKQLQQELWTEFRKHLETSHSFLKATKPLPQHWMNLAIGRSGFKLLATQNTAKSRIGAAMVMNDSRAKIFFHSLQEQQPQIESELGWTLEWQELPGKKESRLAMYLPNIDPSDRKKWPEICEWLQKRLEKMHKVLAPRVKALDSQMPDSASETE